MTEHERYRLYGIIGDYPLVGAFLSDQAPTPFWNNQVATWTAEALTILKRRRIEGIAELAYNYVLQSNQIARPRFTQQDSGNIAIVTATTGLMCIGALADPHDVSFVIPNLTRSLERRDFFHPEVQAPHINTTADIIDKGWLARFSPTIQHDIEAILR